MRKEEIFFQNNLTILIKRRSIESVLQITLLLGIKMRSSIENAIKFHSFFFNITIYKG
jgi:hypothetical protein